MRTVCSQSSYFLFIVYMCTCALAGMCVSSTQVKSEDSFWELVFTCYLAEQVGLSRFCHSVDSRSWSASFQVILLSVPPVLH